MCILVGINNNGGNMKAFSADIPKEKYILGANSRTFNKYFFNFQTIYKEHASKWSQASDYFTKNVLFFTEILKVH